MEALAETTKGYNWTFAALQTYSRHGSILTCSLEGSLAKGETKKRRTVGKVEIFEEGLDGLPERLGDDPLRMIIVGTNPSGHAW